jgi:hypothetical protein
MEVKKLIAQGTAAGVLGLSALGAAVVPAAADPWQPDWDDHSGLWYDRDNNWQQWRHESRDWRQDQWRDWRQDQWHDWWRANKWRHDDHPPWGYGRPPAVYWRGHPPPVYDYWGYQVYPVWHPQFNVFGFWLFGIFIPVIVI